jgi:hypothetical protein
VIGDVLRVLLDETVEIGTVSPNHILELSLGIKEVRDERRLGDRVPVKARVLMQPIGEVIRRYCKWVRCVEPKAKG